MNALVSVVTKDVNFYKQVTHILPAESVRGLFKMTPPGGDISRAMIIITDGSDPAVFNSDATIFVIAEELPKPMKESASVRFYKKGDFYPEIFSKDVEEWLNVATFLENADERTQVAVEREFTYREALKDYEKKFETASKLQRSVMLPNTPKGFGLSVHYQPYFQVSGDLLIIQEVGDSVFIVVGDITDHGYASGLYAASLYAAIRTYLDLASPFYLNLESLVRFVQHSSSYYQPKDYGVVRQQTSATMLFCEIDKSAQVARFINCGHGNEPPILISADNTAQVLRFGKDTENELLLAIGDFTVIHPSKTAEYPFPPGSGLVFYTDGVTEVFKDSYRKEMVSEYSAKRLFSSVQGEVSKGGWSPESVVENIKKDAESYSISPEFNYDITGNVITAATDDITIAALRWEENGK